MATSAATARKAAYLFLVLCVGTLLVFGGLRLYEKFGPRHIAVDGVPFGLPAGTQIAKGDFPELDGGLADLPIQTKAELRRAEEMSRGGNFRSAYEIFDAVSLMYPEVLASAWGEVNTLFEMDSLNTLEHDRLNLLVGKIQGRFPGSGISIYLDSRKAFVMGNVPAALEMARVAVSKSPAVYELRLWLARLLNDNSNYIQATEESHAAISLSAGADARTYELLANLFHTQGLLDSCSSVVEYALSQFPANVRLMLLQGVLMEYQGQYDAAEKVYQRALAFEPGFKDAAVALSTLGEKTAPGVGGGSAMSPRERMQGAYDILAPLVDRYPENLPLREALGLAYLKGRDFDQARNQFQEIAKRDAEYPDIQQRIQETNVTRPMLVQAHDGLAEDLSRAVDSLRGSSGPSTTHDFSTMLGHYLVRYGATPGEFFKKYAVSNFRPIKSNVWQESFYDAPYKHTYTVVFDSLNHFKEVHVVVYDSSTSSHHLGVAPEVFTRFLKQNSRISGIGNSTGETDCGDSIVIDAAVWETQDNFEILARFVGKPEEIRMVRYDKARMTPGMKLCDHIPYLKEF